jgi:hypothetical protein
MIAKEFENLDEMEKMKAIAYNAKKLSEREDDVFYYNLYQLDSFYIEEKIEKRPEGSFYSPSHFSTVLNIRQFKKLD